MLTRPLTVVLLVLGFGITSAADKPIFEVLDLDRDGFISVEEAAADEGVMLAFSDADSDEDGRLSQDEYEGISL